MLELHFSLSGVRSGIPSKARFAHWLNAALALAMQQKGRPALRLAANAEIALRLVDSIQAQAFNLQYRGKDYATNVLSFPFEIPPGLPKSYRQDIVGDLVLCAPVIASEAAQQQKSLTAHYAHMSVHGLLHLLGWDHELPDAAEAMEALEIKILASLGFPNPYEDADVGTRKG